MKNAVLLSTAYLPPVQWFTKLLAYKHIYVEQYDHYHKQTYRNRCIITSQAGLQSLTIPVTLGEGKTFTRDVKISDHGNWRHLHWQALVSAYENSAFFEFYADDFQRIYEEKNESLVSFNQSLVKLTCGLLDIDCDMQLTSEYASPQQLDADDFRDAINPKHPQRDPSLTPKEYYQVFAARNGFKPNVSIADLLFNEGPEAIFTLRNSISQSLFS